MQVEITNGNKRIGQITFDNEKVMKSFLASLDKGIRYEIERKGEAVTLAPFPARAEEK